MFNPRSNQCFFHFAGLNYSLFFEATRGAVNKFVFLKQQNFGVSRAPVQPKKESRRSGGSECRRQVTTSGSRPRPLPMRLF
jgi:hypothetical protein